MNKEKEEQADRLYEQGLHIFAMPKDKESRMLAVEKLQKAWDLYLEAGCKEKARDIESLLVDIYKKRAEAARKSREASVVEEVTGKFDDWWLFFRIGCFGFGGPMAVFGLLEDELVEKRKILSDKDFLEGAVLGDVLPGPVTMDIVTYTGFKLRTWKGALIGTVAFILPSFIIMLLIAIYYEQFIMAPKVTIILKALSAAVTGLILSVGLKLSKAEIKNYREALLMAWAFITSAIFKVDMAIIVVLAGVAGIILYRHDAEPEDTHAAGAPGAIPGKGGKQ